MTTMSRRGPGSPEKIARRMAALVWAVAAGEGLDGCEGEAEGFREDGGETDFAVSDLGDGGGAAEGELV